MHCILSGLTELINGLYALSGVNACAAAYANLSGDTKGNAFPASRGPRMVDPRGLVDGELLPLLEAFPDFDLNLDVLPGVRNAIASAAGASMQTRSSHVSVSETTLSRTDGPAIRVAIYRPKDLVGPAPAVLHLHGGGFVAGVPEMADAANCRMALRLGCVVVSVDYRLAPESAFPSALDDAYAVLEWLAAGADVLSVDTTRLALCGESAGGGLAAGLALFARDRGGPSLRHVSLIYPMIDDRTCTHASPVWQGAFGWTPASNHFGWESYLGQTPGGSEVPIYAAAGRAEDLMGLGTFFIAVGALDLFLSENLDFARRLAASGVPTELHVYPGAYHGFYGMIDTALGRRAEEERLAALSRAFADGLK
jgi:acetyl esterase/lipase